MGGTARGCGSAVVDIAPVVIAAALTGLRGSYSMYAANQDRHQLTIINDTCE
jgi:hypothetical protein